MTKKILGGLLLTLSVAGAFVVQAQPTKISRIGYLTGSPISGGSARREAFRLGLRELGYVEGKNLSIEWRSAERNLDRLPALATWNRWNDWKGYR